MASTTSPAAPQRRDESLLAFVARSFGNPVMVKTESPPSEGKFVGHDVYVGQCNPSNRLQLAALVRAGSMSPVESLADLNWSSLHFVDPATSRVAVAGPPSHVDLPALDRVRMPSAPGNWAHNDRREYRLPDASGGRPLRGVLMEANASDVPFGVSRLVPEVSLYTFAFSKNAWLQRL